MSVIDLTGYSTYWPYRTEDQANTDTLAQPVSPSQAYTNQSLIKAAVEALDASSTARDGRSISEVVSSPDAASEFVAGGTFTVDPTNARHGYIKVSDSLNPLTANMVVDLNPTAAGRVAGNFVTVIKGDTSDFTVTVTGFDADGLGTYVLKRYRDSVECFVQTTTDNSGPGPGGVKFERGIQGRPNPYAADISNAEGDTAEARLSALEATPQPNTIESDGSGAWSPDYDTEIVDYGIVTFERESADVTAGPLELTWPTMPVGAIHNIRFLEAATITAATRVFTVEASWEDGSGDGEITITQAGVTWTDLGAAVGDVISGGPFGSPTTITEIESSTLIHTADAPGETDSGTISLTAPADSIDGARSIATPTMTSNGAIMVLARQTASTATSRGTLISGERVGDLAGVAAQRLVYIDDNGDISGLSVGTGLAVDGTEITATGGVTFSTEDKTADFTPSSASSNGGLTRVLADGSDVTISLPVTLTGRRSWVFWVDPASTNDVLLTIEDTILLRTGDLTISDETVANITTTNLEVGFGLTGEDIPSSTTIATVGSGTLEMSNQAEATATSVEITIDAGVQGSINGWTAADLPIKLQPGLTVVEQISEGFGPVFEARGGVDGGNQIPTITETDSFLIGTEHIGKLVLCNKGSGMNATIQPNADLPIPFSAAATSWVKLMQIGAGAVTVVEGSGVTANPTPGQTLVSAGQYASLLITKIGTNTHVVEGGLDS